MNHVDPETLAAWADGALSSEQARVVESHLADCSACRAVAAAFSSTMASEERVVHDGRTAAPVSAGKWILPLAATILLAAGVAWKYWPRESPKQMAVAQPAPVVAPPPVAPAPAPTPAKPPKAKVVRPSREAAESARPSSAVPVAPPPAPLPAPPPRAVMASPPSAPIAPAQLPPPTRILDDKRANVAVQSGVNIGGLGSGGSGNGVNAGGGGGAAGGRGGGARAVIIASTPPIRWRVTPPNVVARSVDNGLNWTVVPLDAAGVQLVSGAAPNASVCWLVGRVGAVFVSKNGDAFKRVPFPEMIDLASVLALDELRATVITADGRTFATDDGGQTWRIARF